MHSQARRARSAAPGFGGPSTGKVRRTHTHIRRGRRGTSVSLGNQSAKAAWRSPGAGRSTGQQPGGARASTRRQRHHAAASRTGTKGGRYLAVVDDDSLAVAADSGPSNAPLPEAAAAAPGEEGSGSGRTRGGRGRRTCGGGGSFRFRYCLRRRGWSSSPRGSCSSCAPRP